MTKQFLMNLLLMFIWVALSGTFYYGNFLFGFMLGYFILWILAKGENRKNKKYFNRVPKAIGFVLYFLYEMIKANIHVAYDVITPKYFMKPGIVKYPIDLDDDWEINLLSSCISLTPGTLVMDISADKKVMYIHNMYLKDKDTFIKEIKEGFEKRILEITR
ncbi:multisubunit sodium/proton antiporter, MrpE subunit [Pseudopedobacter saltans DSM 12145]|uniref:Multisubunit sodium/proton antiporter, MrpE subunit n=1 Tax=Pseudopedobacter saltans (strain ATCC 51119 / DSM 12145 / JCM 21818 / CCUG 39354 / LMG 10337 / NBRC 100064 / NCIMB 13643) TaxID=762903 RepID=F0SE84_PSESL|nr:Na+/H+ antiporter subunit E [Pseudopedobacter saltans]ADY54006.1 multisubunit sodium/proton antiporter, MrpE subunit [Pseudopedobacter saltans DSM 12145]